MTAQCTLPGCTSLDSNPMAFLPCVSCGINNAHHLCSLNAAANIIKKDVLTAAMEANIGIQFCSLRCASSYYQSIKPTDGGDGTGEGTGESIRAITDKDMANTERYLEYRVSAPNNANRTRVLGAMAIGVMVGDGRGGKKALVDLDDEYWKAIANKPSNSDLYDELERRRIINIHREKYPKRTTRGVLIGALERTGGDIEDAFLTSSINALVSSTRKRKMRSPDDARGVGDIAQAPTSAGASSTLLQPTPSDYVDAEDLTFATVYEFSNGIQEDISFKDGTSKVDFSAQPKMAALVISALDIFKKLDYRGIPVNSTEAKHSMMKYINEHRRQPEEDGRYELAIVQFVFYFKLRWKPEKIPARNMERVNLFLRIVGVTLHPELKDLVEKLLSGQKNIDDHDLGDDTISGGWDHLAAKCNEKSFEVPIPLLEPNDDSEAAITVPYWDFYDPNFDVGNSIPLVADGKAMKKILYETIIRPYRTLVDKWTKSETGNGGDNVLLSHVWSNNLPWLTYIFVLDQQMSNGETGGLFLYDRSGVVPAEYRVEEGAGAHLDGAGSTKSTSSPGGKSSKRMKDLEAFFDMAAERGLFGGDNKSRTIVDIVEDLRETKEQISRWKKLQREEFDSDSDSDGDSDDDAMNTSELAIMKLKQRKKELKSELKNHN